LPNPKLKAAAIIGVAPPKAAAAACFAAEKLRRRPDGCRARAALEVPSLPVAVSATAGSIQAQEQAAAGRHCSSAPGDEGEGRGGGGGGAGGLPVLPHPPHADGGPGHPAVGEDVRARVRPGLRGARPLSRPRRSGGGRQGQGHTGRWRCRRHTQRRAPGGRPDVVRALWSRGARVAFGRGGEGSRAPRSGGGDAASGEVVVVEPVVLIGGGSGPGEVGVEPVVLVGGGVRGVHVVLVVG